MITLLIDGTPAGKGRPRFNRNNGRAYTDKQTATAEDRVRLAWIEAGRPRIDGPLTLTAVLVLARPKAHLLTSGELSASGRRQDWPCRKPDLDNAVKLIMDALNGCAYRDDVDVIELHVYRRWAHPGEHEHTVVRLKPARAATAPQAVTPLVRSEWADDLDLRPRPEAA